MADQPAPINVSPANNETNVSVLPLLIARAEASSIEAAFVEQYDADDGLPIVVGWDDDPRRR